MVVDDSSKESGMSHVEQVDSENPPRRRSSVVEIEHTETPIWEVRKTYTKQGFMGIFSSRYVFVCAAFATMGGLLFGYDQGVVSITLVMPQFLEEFPQVSSTASGAGFLKGLMTAMIELGAFIGKKYLHAF